VVADHALGIYRILQESLNNVSRHADAHRVDVSLYRRGAQLRLSVYDDGRGFDLTRAVGAGGCGIAGMHERANLVNGSLEIRSIPGEGTRVELTVQLASLEAA
jgi:signal transduction histidine kinase